LLSFRSFSRWARTDSKSGGCNSSYQPSSRGLYI
jgi:hypothetical protein